MEASVLLRRNAASFGERYPTLRGPSNFKYEGDTLLRNIGTHFTSDEASLQKEQNPRLRRFRKLKTRSIYKENF